MMPAGWSLSDNEWAEEFRAESWNEMVPDQNLKYATWIKAMSWIPNVNSNDTMNAK
jgi:hypothetical protein